MVVDTSALIAFILDEEDADKYEDTLTGSEQTLLSAASFLEATIVLKRHGRDADWLLDPALRRFDIDLAPVTVEQAYLAQDAFYRYGKGGGHPAQLNFGDCFAYALSKALDAPLLFKGNDFAQTDVKRI